MIVIVGCVVVTLCVLGGFVWSGGHIGALVHPSEILTIGGAALGALIVMSPRKVLGDLLRSIMQTFKGSPFNKAAYCDLFGVLYDMLSVARRDGMLGLEAHIADPGQSEIFNKHPSIAHNHHVVEFICSAFAPVIEGTADAAQLEALLETDLKVLEDEHHAPIGVLSKTADALPGFGIVAAVLGIVTTMSQLGDDTSRIGMHIAGALVGTFLGILLCYGFVGPLGAAMENRVQEDGRAFECVKIALLANLRGYNPKIAVEFARKSLSANTRPGFQDLEDHLKASPRGKATA